MKHYLLLILLTLLGILLFFGLAEALHLPLLVDPAPWLQRGDLLAAAIGIALLIMDILLPVPASLVMIANGAIFGFWWGALLSLIGGLGAGLFAFGLGRRGGPLLDRFIPEEERARGDALINQWGDIAVVVTRPIPMIAETVAVLAGTSPLTWRRMTVATLAGTLPAAVLYALTGALAVTLNSTLWTFALVMLTAGLLWLAGRRWTDQVEETRPEGG